MIEKLNEQALLNASTKAYRTALIRKINQLVDAVNVGVVWDNKVAADRADLQLQADIVETVIDEYNVMCE